MSLRMSQGPITMHTHKQLSACRCRRYCLQPFFLLLSSCGLHQFVLTVQVNAGLSFFFCLLIIHLKKIFLTLLWGVITLICCLLNCGLAISFYHREKNKEMHIDYYPKPNLLTMLYLFAESDLY